MIEGYPVIEKGIIWRKENGDILVFNAETGDIFVLNPTASFFWELADGKHSFDEMIDAMVKEFRVGKKECALDLTKIMRQMIKSRLLRVDRTHVL